MIGRPVSLARNMWWHARLLPAPSVLAWRTRRQRVPRLDAICIYRLANAETVAELVSDLPEARWALWALDAVHPSLASLTVGTGPGYRAALLNRLAESLGAVDAGAFLLHIDDDVEVTAGSLGLLAKAAAVVQMDLAQPAHDPKSHASWEFTRARGLTLGRLTRFVECGPATLFSPRARSLLLPYPDHLQMGWGIEAIWASLANKHILRFGIIDAVRVRHLGSVASSYSSESEWAFAREELARAGLTNFEELQVVLKRWGLLHPLVA